MRKCFVPHCPCDSAGFMPVSQDQVLGLCAKHAAEWQDSYHRNLMLPDFKAKFGREGAVKIVTEWASNEASH